MLKIECVKILGSVGYVILEMGQKPIKYYSHMNDDNIIQWVDFLYNAKSFSSREKAEEVLHILSLALDSGDINA